MRVKRRLFDDWTAEEVRDTFHIKSIKSHPFMTEWLAAIHTPDIQKSAFLEAKRALLERFYRTWNEDELKFRFISQVVELTELIGQGYNTFTQRPLSAVVENIRLYGRPELMVASGEDNPKKPYFFIHEYKPSRKSEDPLGQLLAAMLAAQTHNADELPLMGCFVIGALWQFVVLDAKTYLVSRTYDANHTDDLLAIYSALCQAKVYIEDRVK